MESSERDSGFAERLKQVVKDYGSANSLAAAIGRSEGAVRNWLNGKSEPTVSSLVAICRVTGTTVDWLATGQEPRGAQQSLELRESRASYLAGAPAQPAPDEELTRMILEALEQEILSRQLAFTPAKKSAIFVESYRFIGKQEKFDAAIVARLVKLAS